MKSRLFTISTLVIYVFMFSVSGQQAPAKEGTNVGEKFHWYDEFKAETINGDKITNETFKGKHVFIDFWATWCPPCRMEFPFLARVEKKLAGDKFLMLGISLDENVDLIEPFKKEYGVKYPNIADGKGWQSEWAVKYGIRSIPTNFLLDGEGKIIAKNLRGYQVEYETTKALDVESAIVYVIDSAKALEEGRIEDARLNTEKAYKLEPENPETILARANVYLAEEKLNEAKEWYAKSFEKANEALDMYFTFRLHEKAGQSCKSEEDWIALIKNSETTGSKLEGFNRILNNAALIKTLDENGRKKDSLKQRKTLLALIDEQPEGLKRQLVRDRKRVEDEIKELEEQLGKE